jgi:flagellar hook-associated protein 2
MATTATSALSSSTSAALASSPAALAAANKASAQKLITSLNAGSGVDVSALAQNLVDAERAPQENAIKAKITKNESRISGYSALSFVLDGVKTALTALKDQNSFSSLVANNTNTSAFSVTAAATAVEGSHSVNVLQLAKAQRTVTEGLASPTASLNGGKAITFSLTVGGTSTDIKLPDGYDTPQNVVDFINTAKKGVTAKLVNTGDGSANPYQIVLTGDTGSAGAFSLTPKFSAGGVPAPNASVNNGLGMTLKLSVGGQAIPNIVLPDGQDTPQHMMDAINATNSGVTASLVANADGSTYPYKLMLTGPSGTPSDFSLSVNYGLGDEVMVQPGLGLKSTNPVNQAASDAKVKVDGITFTRASNTMTDVVPGLTFTLKDVTSTPATVDLSRDNTGIKDKLTALVTAYNDANTIMGEVSNPKSTFDTYGATLVGDSTVRSLKQQLRQMVTGPSSTPGTGLGSLWQMGISVNETGVMSIDSTKLDKALTDNYSDVVKAFSGNQNGLTIYSPAPGGIAGDAVRKLTKMLGADGILKSQSTSAETQNTKFQADLDKLGVRMDSLLKRYQKQFAAMDSMVGSVNSQKTSLKSSFDGMMASLTGKSG